MRLERVLEEARAKGYPIEDNGLGNLWVVLPREGFKAAMAHYRDLGFNYLADIVGLDYLTYPDPKPERFAVVYELVSLPGWKDGDGSRFFVRVYVPEKDPRLPTVTDLWGSANFLEREVYDLFGIVFEGHPRRKDFPGGETPTLFREGRYIIPSEFRAAITGKDPGLTLYRAGSRKGYRALWADLMKAKEVK